MQSKVLVIDDDDVNHDIVNSMLGQHYDIKSALGGKKGLELLSQGEFDAILLDVVMPEVSGYEVCEQLRLKISYKDFALVEMTTLLNPLMLMS